MTNSRDKFSGGGGDSPPLPQLPASSGDGKKTQRTASMPIENCLTEGVQSEAVCPNCAHDLWGGPDARLWTEKKNVTANDYSLSCISAADSCTSSPW